MKRGQEQITVSRYVRTSDGGTTRVEDLTEEERKEFGQWLAVTLMNELYLGKAEFTVEHGKQKETA